MSLTISRIVISVLTAVIMSTAFSQASFAYSSMDSWKDSWKLNVARSILNLNDSSKSTTLHINNSGVPETPSANVNELIVVANDGNVYVATGAAARDALAGKQVDPSRLVQIGMNARSDDKCGFKCQGGLLERHRNITFDTVSGQQRRLPERHN